MVDSAGAQADAPATIRILIVDDHEMFGSSLAFTLNSESDMAVVGTACTGKAALEQAVSTTPDVILLDQQLPDATGTSLIPPLLETSADVQVVMLTASTSDHVLISAIEAGAAGFIDKTRSLGEVAAAIRSAAAGESLVSPKQLARLLPRLRRQDADPTASITVREREVLSLLCDGLSNADIAARMSVSVHTVRNHVANLSAKLNAHSKLEVMAIAVRKGLISR